MKTSLAQYNESKYRLVYENSLDGILLVTPDGKLLSANPSAQQMFGYTEEQLISIGRKGILDEEDPHFQSALSEFQRTGNFRGQITFVRSNGKTFQAEISIRAFHDFQGQLLASLAIRDISERLRAQEEVKDYIARIERMLLGTVGAISEMVELRDPYTAGHEQRVGKLAVDLAAEMGLTEDIQIGLRIAGAVHDIGKIAVPSEILTMPRQLTELEYQLIMIHAQAGYDILSKIDSPWPIAEVARQHHERIDGSGYPRGLKGEEILLEARIMAVADVVESMTSHRPYRAGLGIDAALAEIEQNAGKLYDANVVAACLKLFREKQYQLPPQDREHIRSLELE